MWRSGLNQATLEVLEVQIGIVIANKVNCFSVNEERVEFCVLLDGSQLDTSSVISAPRGEVLVFVTVHVPISLFVDVEGHFAISIRLPESNICVKSANLVIIHFELLTDALVRAKVACLEIETILFTIKFAVYKCSDFPAGHHFLAPLLVLFYVSDRHDFVAGSLLIHIL